MAYTIQHLHHVTATVADAQEDLDFYVKLLGLRLVKQTVNFDNHKVYHFYYGNEVGYPGTIMTTFPYKGEGVRIGNRGTGQVEFTTFAVPSSSNSFWKQRLEAAGLSVTESQRFGDWVLTFSDPSGLQIELLGTEDEREPWVNEEITSKVAIRGIHSVTVPQKNLDASLKLFYETLGFEEVGKEGNRLRIKTLKNASGHYLDFLLEPERDKGKNGIGTVHHVALGIATEEEQAGLHQYLVGAGFKVTDILDRKYFRSIYFREPGGVLIEVATIPPGFTVDETKEGLGKELKLPAWEEVNRADIEAHLPKVSFD